MLSFTQDDFVRANGLFVNNSSLTVDADCQLELFLGSMSVASTRISIDELEGGDSVPARDSITNGGLGFGLDSFDTVRISDCETSEPDPPLEQTPDPGFEFVERVAFAGVEVIVLGLDFDEPGFVTINVFYQNNNAPTVDIICQITLISDVFVVRNLIFGTQDLEQGNSFIEPERFIGFGLNPDSFDRVRLMGCFTT